ncbi:MAG: hypothetical protein V1663_00760 [archaeon]
MEYINESWRYVDDNYYYQSNEESAPPNIYDRWTIYPSATFEWTINEYAGTHIVANSEIWQEDGKNIMTGVNNYFENS